MSKVKKSVGLVLSLLMIISLFTIVPLIASAETSGDFTYTILEDGTAEITGYEGSATELIIPSELDKNLVTSIGNYAFSECASLTSITIPDSVTSIGDSAFSNCNNIKDIKIADNVIQIGYRAFYNTSYYNNEENWENGVLYINNCLISVERKSILEAYPYEIKNGTTAIADYAFSSCEMFSEIIIPKSVTYIGKNTFYRCRRLKKINIPNSIVSIDDKAFFNCPQLMSVNIPKSVKKIGENAFGIVSGKFVDIELNYFGEYEDPDKYEYLGDFHGFGIFEESSFDYSIFKLREFTIIGEKDSEGERYAHDNGLVFKDIEDFTNQTESTTVAPTQSATDQPTESLTTEPIATKPTPDTPKAKDKKANPVKISVKAKTVKLKKLKKKAQYVKAITVSKAQGKVTYKLVKKGSTAKIFKLAKINSKGVITLKKWKKAKKGTYNIKVQITVKGNSKYKPKTVTKTVKIKVK